MWIIYHFNKNVLLKIIFNTFLIVLNSLPFYNLWPLLKKIVNAITQKLLHFQGRDAALLWSSTACVWCEKQWCEVSWVDKANAVTKIMNRIYFFKGQRGGLWYNIPHLPYCDCFCDPGVFIILVLACSAYHRRMRSDGLLKS